MISRLYFIISPLTMTKTSFEKSKINILLLEWVHESAVETFRENGYTNIEYIKWALDQDQLIEKIKDVHFIWIRSRTKLTKEVLSHAKRLKSIGCFCIGTNKVDLETAKEMGVAVFNAPFSNTRSVAELVIAEIILLFRGIAEKNALAHSWGWLKSAVNSYEVRGKNLWIVGYGHIGTQLGILAEDLGMNVYYYDIEKKLSLWNVKSKKTFKELLEISDVVSFHVPETKDTKNMFNKETLAYMKEGRYLVNASRGTVVEIDYLVRYLESGHILWAAIDVFPSEPKGKGEEFVSPLRAFDNVILTPHIGWSTLEAQENIGFEVSQKIVTFSDNGSTIWAVNYPEVSLPTFEWVTRIIHLHMNVPWVLNKINEAFAKNEINISAQYLQTNDKIGYMVMDVETDEVANILQELNDIPGTIRARVLY